MFYLALCYPILSYIVSYQTIQHHSIAYHNSKIICYNLSICPYALIPCQTTPSVIPCPCPQSLPAIPRRTTHKQCNIFAFVGSTWSKFNCLIRLIRILIKNFTGSITCECKESRKIPGHPFKSNPAPGRLHSM